MEAILALEENWQQKRTFSAPRYSGLLPCILGYDHDTFLNFIDGDNLFWAIQKTNHTCSSQKWQKFKICIVVNTQIFAALWVILRGKQTSFIISML